MTTALKTKIYHLVIQAIMLVSILIVMTSIAFAQTGTTAGFQPLVDLPAQAPVKLGGIYKADDLSVYFNKMFFFAISLGGILAVGRLAYAGWLYMLGESYGNLKKAKEIVGDVTIGILILLSIWLILNLINPQLLNLDILNSFSSGSSNSTTNTTNNGSSILNF